MTGHTALAGLLAALAAFGPVFADDRGTALASCETAALAAMQARYPKANEVQALEDQVTVTETPGGQTKVTGGGQYALTVGQWTPFTYTCAYSPTTGQVTSLEIP